MIKRFFLSIFYLGWKSLVWVALKIFFKRTIVRGKEYLHTKGPSILLSNHPNTMVDPIDVAVRSPRMVHFLAKAELFRNPLMRWFFTTFYCIPVERPNFSNGQKVDNSASFAKCDAFLHSGGCLYVSPEGTSILQRHLLPLKSGAARIAISAAVTSDYTIEVKFVSATISYVTQGEFRSTQLITVHEPISNAKWRADYVADPIKAIDTIRNGLAELMQSSMWEDSGKYSAEVDAAVFMSAPYIANRPDEFHDKGMAYSRKMKDWLNTDPAKAEAWANEIGKIKEFLKGKALSKSEWGWIGKEYSFVNKIWRIIALLPSLMFLGIGLIFHLIPNALIGGLWRWVSIEPEYEATVKILAGIILYPIWYGGLLIIAFYQFVPIAIILLMLFLVFVTGHFYYDVLSYCRETMWVFSQSKSNKEALREKNIALNSLISLIGN